MKLLKLSLPILALLATSAQAFNGFAHVMKKHGPRLESIEGPSAGDPDADNSCRRAYARVNAANYHRIVLAFGYGDSTPGDVVYDHYAYEVLKNKLLAPCRGTAATLCGFAKLGNDNSVLRKRVANPDGRSRRTIDIKLIIGSVGPSNSDNTDRWSAGLQNYVCRMASESFHNEVKNGPNTVIYMGHSRNGGGPDFCPPTKTADGNHVNYRHYQARREGIKGLTTSLREAQAAGKTTDLVALMSCDSRLHFYRRLNAAAPKTGFMLTSRSITFNHVFHDTLNVLAGAIEQKCQDPMEMLFLESESHGVKGGTKIFNFFR